MIVYIYALTTLAAVLMTHLVGISTFYYKFPLFDIVPHFLGGVGIAFFAYALVAPVVFSKRLRFRYVVMLTIIVGIVWEIFEVYFQISGYPVGSTKHTLDTIKDLVLDTMGAFLAFFIAETSKRKK